MSEYPKDLSKDDIIRRQRDKINGHKDQIMKLKISNSEIAEINSQLLSFMKRNNLFELFHKQKDELDNGRT